MPFSCSMMISVAPELHCKCRFGQFYMRICSLDQVSAFLPWFLLRYIFRNPILKSNFSSKLDFKIRWLHLDWFNQIWFHSGCDSNLIQARLRPDLAASVNGPIVGCGILTLRCSVVTSISLLQDFSSHWMDEVKEINMATSPWTSMCFCGPIYTGSQI